MNMYISFFSNLHEKRYKKATIVVAVAYRDGCPIKVPISKAKTIKIKNEKTQKLFIIFFCFSVNVGANEYAQKKPMNGFICTVASCAIAANEFE
jgi:hypothetical protein